MLIHASGSTRLTFRKLMARDARLEYLLDTIPFLIYRKQPDFCAHREWYRRGGFKAQICGIVGMTSDNPDPDLRTAAAYDVAYQTLYRLLPPCQHEGMCGPYR